jgi:DNA-binding beta-propeller fold protein YncE
MKRMLLLLAILALPAASHAASKGGRLVALVTAETQNQLIAVELPSGKVMRRLPMPADPQNVEANDHTAVVVSTRGGAVTLVDVPTLRIRKVIHGFASPHIAALSPGGGYAYVTDDARGQLVVLGLARSRVLDRVFVGFGAHHMSFRPHHHELWIALGERARSIHIIDTSQAAHPRRKGWFSPRNTGLMHDLSFAPGGRRLWVTSDDRSEIAVFDAHTQKRLFTLPAGSPPQHVAFRRYAYVTSGNDGRLRIFSVAGRLLGVANVPSGSFNLDLSPTGGVLTSSLTNGLLTYLGISGQTLLSRHVGAATRDVASVTVPPVLSPAPRRPRIATR